MRVLLILAHDGKFLGLHFPFLSNLLGVSVHQILGLLALWRVLLDLVLMRQCVAFGLGLFAVKDGIRVVCLVEAPNLNFQSREQNIFRKNFGADVCRIYLIDGKRPAELVLLHFRDLSLALSPLV